MNPDTCIRCESATPEFGRWLCKACIQALDNPTPTPERPDQGKPVSKRTRPKLPTFKQRPIHPPRKS